MRSKIVRVALDQGSDGFFRLLGSECIANGKQQIVETRYFHRFLLIAGFWKILISHHEPLADGRSPDGESDLSLDDFAAKLESAEGRAIRNEQREFLLGKFADEPELRDILAAQLEPEAYNAYTNKDLATLLGTDVPDIENRKKRLSLRLRKLQTGDQAGREHG